MTDEPYRDHVAPPEHLKLPAVFASTQRYLSAYDRDLRLRRSAERPHLYVLERRIRRRPATNTGMRDLSDMHIQARDGYLHIATVHPSFLPRPHRIIAALRDGGLDIWAAGGSQKVINELEYEEQWGKVTRRRRRLQLFRDIAKDHYDILSRLGNRDGTERTRITVPALPHGHFTGDTA
jgi:hypothetical protein